MAEPARSPLPPGSPGHMLHVRSLRVALPDGRVLIDGVDLRIGAGEVTAMRGRGAELHGALTRAFAGLLADIFVDRRLEASGLPAALVIRAASPRVIAAASSGPPNAPSNASLHLDLAAALVPPR